MAGELVEFENGAYGMAQNLEKTMSVSSSSEDMKISMKENLLNVTGRILDVPVGDALIGRVVDALGRQLTVLVLSKQRKNVQ